MKVLVTGVGGQLGYDVINELSARGFKGVGTDILPEEKVKTAEKTSRFLQTPYVTLDITDERAVEQVIAAEQPDAVIHCAAWTAVDAAEEEENKAKVYAINVDGTAYIARACKKYGCKMVYISTDYVFNGQGDEPWLPDCTEYEPLSEYGRTKLLGEEAVARLVEKYFIVRIAWAFGLNGKNFVKTMLQLGEKCDTIRVVNDQIGTPTYTYDLARLLVDMITTTKYGYYHATNEGGYISWYDFACEIFKQAGYETKVVPVTTAEYGVSKAKRPFNSRLDKKKLTEQGFARLPDWKDALNRYLQNISNE